MIKYCNIAEIHSASSRTELGAQRIAWRLSLVLALTVVTLPLAGADTEGASESVSQCAQDLHIPRHGPGGKIGDVIGPIVVKLVADANGHPQSILVEAKSAPASILLRGWMEESTFSPRCAGKELILKFSFVVEGPPIEYPFSWVTFQSPNHFIVHSRARTPDVFSPPRKAPEKNRN